MKERLSTLTLLLLGCYACGEPEDGLSAVEAAAGNAVVSTARLSQLFERPRDPDAVMAMTRIYGDLNTVANDNAGLSFEEVSKSGLESCVFAEADLIRYEACSLGNGTLDGTVRREGDRLALDLEVSDQAGSGRVTIEVTGRLLREPRWLQGDLRYEAVIEGLPDFPEGLRLVTRAEYVTIALDPIACPLSGELRVDQELLGTRTEPVEVRFGPACTDVLVVRP